MSRIIEILLLMALCLEGCRSEIITQDLGGQWVVTGQGESPDIPVSVNATVPGGIYSDLMNAGVIGDIFYGTGDQDYIWVSLSNWTYTTTFTVDEQLMNSDNINIIFDGLDTFALISINNVAIGEATNMFVQYIFPVKEQLVIGLNTIEVVFLSPVTTAAALAEKQSEDYVVPPDCPSPEFRGACHVNQIRKMQASFSWDWGPSFPSVGIWKNVFLEGFNNAVIRNVVARPSKDPVEDVWNLIIDTYFTVGINELAAGQLFYILSTDDGIVEVNYGVRQTYDIYGEVRVAHSLNVPMASVKRWWPNRYGDQHLYNLIVMFEGDDGEISEKRTRVGFRTVELKQDQLDSGLTFHFVVNDVLMFAKGANEIPLNVLPERGQDPDTIKSILQSAKDTHMNMLRVWGGGVYESDLFYDTCDEMGILIWQDFMFACALYPTRPDYLSNVVDEVRHQIKRLSSHPSIALWAGNNENELALAQNWFGTWENFEFYKGDFIKLYVDTIKTEVQRMLPFATFLTASPTNGKESEDEGYIAQDPQNSFYGDVHFYSYYADSLDPKSYPIPRFASEFGYQSMPDVDAWLTVTDDIANLAPAGVFVDHRQHHPGGLEQNNILIDFQLQLPDNSSENYYKTYIYYSQIVQAMSIKVEVEHYRSFKGVLDSQGQGNTMGALFWQLNDVWVAPTWSGIDFTGKWKMLQYFALDFFSPAIVTAKLVNDVKLEVYFISDVPATDGTIAVTLTTTVYQWNSLTPVASNVVSVDVENTNNAALLLSTNATELLVNAGCGADYDVAKTNCFLHLEVKQAPFFVTPNNYFFFDKLKNSNIQSASVAITSIVQTDGKVFNISISTDSIALFVWLDSHQIKGKFSENGFLQVTESKTVTFTTTLENVTTEELLDAVTVTHLRDPVYN